MLAVDGQQTLRHCCCAASIISAPAVTSASLLASATVLPASTAAMAGLQAGAANDRRHNEIGVGRRGFDQGVLARGGAAAGSDQQLPARSRSATFVGDHRKLGTGST